MWTTLTGVVQMTFVIVNSKMWNMVRLQVLTATSMKMTVLWNVASCSLVDTDRRFRGVYCIHHQGDDGGSKHVQIVGEYQTTRRDTSKDLSHLSKISNMY
jgi:hypothetical protein